MLCCTAPIGEVMRLLVALAGGDNGETFVLDDPMQVVIELLRRDFFSVFVAAKPRH